MEHLLLTFISLKLASVALHGNRCLGIGRKAKGAFCPLGRRRLCQQIKLIGKIGTQKQQAKNAGIIAATLSKIHFVSYNNYTKAEI